MNRLQVSCTLLLTSITFRWTVNRSLVNHSSLELPGNVIRLADDFLFDLAGQVQHRLHLHSGRALVLAQRHERPDVGIHI